VFDAIRDRRTYAATRSRIDLYASHADGRYAIRAASGEGIREAAGRFGEKAA
jgi:hypothetical protein